MGKSFTFFAAVVTAGIAGTNALGDSGLEPPMDLLATQLRDQGFACDHPDNAQFDQKESKPNATVWLVECKGVRYRMLVVPDLAAKIKKLDN